MKTRSGFVSNSSSSSFVVLGILLDQEENPTRKVLEKFISRDILDKLAKNSYGEANNWQEYGDKNDSNGEILHELGNRPEYGNLIIRDNYDDGAPEGKTIVGIEIADGDQTAWPQKITSLTNLLAQAEKTGLPTKDLQIITGSRMC